MKPEDLMINMGFFGLHRVSFLFDPCAIHGVLCTDLRGLKTIRRINQDMRCPGHLPGTTLIMKVKVNSSLEQATKAQRGSRSIALLVL